MDTIQSETNHPVDPDKPRNYQKKSVQDIIIILVGVLLVAIALASVFLYGKKSTPSEPALIEKPMPLTITSKEGVPFSVWLKMPSYAPPNSKYITRIFSGRKFVITALSPMSVEGDVILLSENDQSFKKMLTRSSLNGPEKEFAFIIEIPVDVETGAYVLSFVSADGAHHNLPMSIEGLNSNELLTAEDLKPYESLTAQVLGAVKPLQKDAVVHRSVVCRLNDCYWEMVFGGNPRNPQELIMSSKNDLAARSTNAGRTWSDEVYYSLGAAPITTAEDSRLGFFKDGSFAYTSHAIVQNELGNHIKTGSIVTGGYTGNVEASLFDKPPSSLDKYPTILGDWLLDFPVLAIDPNTDAIYITTNGSWFEDTKEREYAFYTSYDKGKTFKKYPLRYTGGAIKSLTVGPDGTLYGIKADFRNDSSVTDYTLLRFSSVDPPVFEEIPTPAIFLGGGMRTFQGSPRGLALFDAAEIVADTHEASPHTGRLYLVWSQANRTVIDAKFEYGEAAYDLNVFTSFSDDKGATWSSPVRVNDDKGYTDQVAFGPRVDALGELHVAFLDHRQSPAKPFLDVYYSHSSDGVHFSPNLRVSEAPIPITMGGRLLGDYLDMVMPYKDRTYVVYPCGGEGLTGPTPVIKPRDACFAEVRTKGAELGPNPGVLRSVGPLSVFLSLKNSDDVGTKLDVRAELFRNNEKISVVEKQCITGIGSGKPKEFSLSFDPTVLTATTTNINAGDILKLKLTARIGTALSGSECVGHRSGALQFSYGSGSARARLGLETNLGGKVDHFLINDGEDKLSQYLIEDSIKTKTVGVSVGQGNPWRDIGTWSVSVSR